MSLSPTPTGPEAAPGTTSVPAPELPPEAAPGSTTSVPAPELPPEAPAPVVGEPAATSSEVAELRAQIGQLTALLTRQAVAVPAAVSAAAEPVHLSADEVPTVGEAVVFQDRPGVVLSVLSAPRSAKRDGSDPWQQFSCVVGLFKEARVVDAEDLERL